MEIQVAYLVSTLAGIFPPMREPEYARLKGSIRQAGLLEPIVMWRGAVIDGRHRLRACLELGIDPRFLTLPDDAAPLEYVIDRNDARRNPSVQQRVASAFRASEISGPGRRPSDDNCANLRSYMTQGEAAKKFGVSVRSIAHAARILGRDSAAAPSLRQAFLAGRVAASDGASIANEAPGVQERAVAMKLSRESRTLRGAVELIRKEMSGQDDADWAAAPTGTAAPGTATLHVSPLSGLEPLIPPASMDRVITFLPDNAWRGSILRDLATLAVHSLKRSGSMLLLTGTEHLGEILEQLRHDEMSLLCAFHYTHPGGSPNTRSPHKIPHAQKLLLVLGRPEFRLDSGYDPITVPPAPEGSDENPLSARLMVGMQMIVERFTRPGDNVLDPFLAGRADLALAATTLGRNFTGAWNEPAAIDHIRRRLAREGISIVE